MELNFYARVTLHQSGCFSKSYVIVSWFMKPTPNIAKIQTNEDKEDFGPKASTVADGAVGGLTEVSFYCSAPLITAFVISSSVKLGRPSSLSTTSTCYGMGYLSHKLVFLSSVPLSRPIEWALCVNSVTPCLQTLKWS